jgi:hypothetical protein
MSSRFGLLEASCFAWASLLPVVGCLLGFFVLVVMMNDLSSKWQATLATQASRSVELADEEGEGWDEDFFWAGAAGFDFAAAVDVEAVVAEQEDERARMKSGEVAR